MEATEISKVIAKDIIESIKHDNMIVVVDGKEYELDVNDDGVIEVIKETDDFCKTMKFKVQVIAESVSIDHYTPNQ